MAANAKARAAAQEAEDAARKAAEQAELDRAFPALPGEDDIITGNWFPGAPDHAGHRTHQHPFHGLFNVYCSCGAFLYAAVPCFVVEEGYEPPPPPDHCPICRARGEGAQ